MTIKNAIKLLYGTLPPRPREAFRYLCKHKRPPRLSPPKSFNEKILFRKLYWSNPLFSTLSDKIEAKKWIYDNVPDLYCPKTLDSGLRITKNNIYSAIESTGRCVVKTRSGSGVCFFADRDTSSKQIDLIVERINNYQPKEFGGLQHETWYSKHAPGYLIEENLNTNLSQQLPDYKFHVFTDEAHNTQRVILQVDFDRFTFHTRSLFTEELSWLPASLKYPCVHSSIHAPDSFEAMLRSAKLLGSYFSYVRVDLYDRNSQPYFGELTFAPGSGREAFKPAFFDFWLGSMWTDDPRH